jgi:tetratricopeptide (TPR) repeat protein
MRPLRAFTGRSRRREAIVTRIGRATALSLLLLAVAGCGSLGLLTTRYRAEKALWAVQRDEARLKLAGERPDSSALARLREEYAGIRKRFPIPPEAKPGSRGEEIRVDFIRILGNAELSAARIAMIARQPEDALEHARWVSVAAGRDSFLSREAELRVVDALQALRRYRAAADTMWAIVDRYPPVPPRTPDEEDPVLKMPGLVTALHMQLGDSAAARQDRRRALAYYQRVLARHPTPLLEAQVRTLEVQTQLALGDRNGALGTLTAFQALVDSTPALKDLQAELLLARGGVQAMEGGNPKAALAAYDEVVKRYPDSPYAAQALLESGVVLEQHGDKKGALARYRQAVEKYPNDSGTGPIALFRGAMLEDQLGDWAEAKQDLEAIPVRFPNSQGALEAPFAVVAHYQRSGEGAAMHDAILKAVGTYRGLIARDSTAAGNAALRWNITRCYAMLDRPKDALTVVDEMTLKDPRSPFTALALAQGADLAIKNGESARGRAYLEKYLVLFPGSPGAPKVRARLQKLPARSN